MHNRIFADQRDFKLIDSATIQQIKDATDIVDVIGDFVDLKKSGTNFKARSPFTDEKTPSFYVVPGKDIFKCFSSGKGGDSITFVMEHEGFSYIEALKYLAQKYGIEINEEQPTEEQLAARTERESLLIALGFAQEYFQNTLLNTEEGKSIGLSYFKERGFTEETIRAFGLGYSLDVWDGLTKTALEKHYSLDILEKAGLTIVKEDKKYDRFRGRVIFPIHSVAGKVIAFGARILKTDKKQPKYVNSPETEVYHKSNVLYGIAQAKNSIRNEDNCFLVEGYTDVISMAQAGITNVVASSGTALTKEQIKLISRYTQNVTVLYDGDQAGIKASIRGIDLILEAGLDVKVVALPEGEDPDSQARNLGGPEFKKFIDNTQKDFLTFKTELFLKGVENDPIAKAKVIREIVESIAKIPDSIKRSVFFQQCSRLLDIDESTLIQEYNKMVFQNRNEKKSDPPPFDEPPIFIPEEEEMAMAGFKKKEDVFTPVVGQEREIVRLLLNYADMSLTEDQKLHEYLLSEIEEIEFDSPLYSEILGIYRQQLANGIIPDVGFFMATASEEVKNEVVNLITEKYELSDNWAEHKIFVPKDEDILSSLTYKSILRLKWRKIQQMMKEVEEKMLSAESDDEVMNLQRIHMKLHESSIEVAKILDIVVAR